MYPVFQIGVFAGLAYVCSPFPVGGRIHSYNIVRIWWAMIKVELLTCEGQACESRLA